MADPVALAEVSADPAGCAVRLRDVTKAYDNGVMALGPIDLDVRHGEFVSLLGPSGLRCRQMAATESALCFRSQP
jgi:NitT/TauT family transport system ATP-binding protein